MTQKKQSEIRIKYEAPLRDGKKISSNGFTLKIETGNADMNKRADFVMQLDPSLAQEDAAEIIHKQFGHFLCKYKGETLVSNGQNGAGTPSFRCKSCETNMSIWNTFEMTLFKYKKIIYAMLSYFCGSSTADSSRIYGLGKGLLNEVRMSLPSLDYCKNGEIESVEKDGSKFAVTTIDMMYKGNKGLMLGVSGGTEIGVLGNENTGEGLDEFFNKVEENIKTDKYIFVMDMRFNVARKILKKFGEKAIIILQSHSLWGDVYVYFYKDGWHTLHIRTDIFTEASKKSREEELLAPGEFELYEGLKKINPQMALDQLNETVLRNMAEELVKKIKNTDWASGGRIDLVMHAKTSKLNSVLKKLEKLNIDTTINIREINNVIQELIDKYQKRPGKKMKQKIVNSWKGFTILKEEINKLSEALLKMPLKTKPKKKSSKKKEDNCDEDSNIMISCKPRLIYRGKIGDHSIPEPAKWILDLLKMVFDGKEITNNHCEGRFGGIGLEFRKGRSIYLDRALTNVLLRRKEMVQIIEFIVSNYPLSNLGKRGQRRGRKRIFEGKSYEIVYKDKLGIETKRTIDVNKIKKGKIFAHCHLRDDDRTFRRNRIKAIASI